MPKGDLKRRIEEGGLKQYMDPRLKKALAHPIREHAMAVFSERIASGTDIAEEVDLDVTDFYSHIELLEELEAIVEVEPPANRRRGRGSAARYFRANTRFLINNKESMRLPEAIDGAINASNLRAIFDEAVESLLAGTFSACPDRHVSWIPVDLDEIGWHDTMEILDFTMRWLTRVHREAALRLAESGEAGIPTTVGLLGFGRPEGYSYGMGSVDE